MDDARAGGAGASAGAAEAAHRIGRELDAAGFLYGAVITGAAIAVVDESEVTAGTVVGGTLAALMVFWLVHVYARVLADRLRMPGAALGQRLREALHHEWSIVVGGLPALVVLIVVDAVADLETAVGTAIWATAVLLGGAGYLAARLAGVRGWRLVGNTAIATVIGMLVVTLDSALH